MSGTRDYPGHYAWPGVGAMTYSSRTITEWPADLGDVKRA